MRLILLSLATLVACSSDDKLTVNNAHPVALITSHSTGDTVHEGSTATFMGSTTDTTDESGPEVVYRVDLRGAAVLEPPCDPRRERCEGRVLMGGTLAFSGTRMATGRRAPPTCVS
jgi:hypothetical protein